MRVTNEEAACQPLEEIFSRTEVEKMLCPECFTRMSVVADGWGNPSWVCPNCRCALDYSREDEEPFFEAEEDKLEP